MIVFYRKLQKHGHTLAITLPRRIREAWGAKRGDHIKYLFHNDGSLELQLVREGKRESTLALPFEAPDDPGTARAAADEDRPGEDSRAGTVTF